MVGRTKLPAFSKEPVRVICPKPRSGDISPATGFSRWSTQFQLLSRIATKDPVAPAAFAPMALHRFGFLFHRLKPVAAEMPPLRGFRAITRTGSKEGSLRAVPAVCRHP